MQPTRFQTDAPLEHDSTLLLVRSLADALEAGESDVAANLLDQLARIRENDLFREMGQVTRQLHEAIVGIHADRSLASLTEEDMPDARQRLDFVLEKTEDAAHRTLTAVESALPVADNLSTRAVALRDEWARFRNRDLSAEEFRELVPEIAGFLDGISDDTQILHARLNDILMAQDYQDITGQVIRRVIGTVRSVEERMVALIRARGGGAVVAMAGTAEAVETVAADGPEGPAVGKADDAEYVNGQDDVDDLLSSLGF